MRPDMRRLRIEFFDLDPSRLHRHINVLCNALLAFRIPIQSPISNVVDIGINDLTTVGARRIREVLAKVDGWRIAGPSCLHDSDHGLLTSVKGPNHTPTTWKCVTRNCAYEQPIEGSLFVSWWDFADMLRTRTNPNYAGAVARREYDRMNGRKFHPPVYDEAKPSEVRCGANEDCPTCDKLRAAEATVNVGVETGRISSKNPLLSNMPRPKLSEWITDADREEERLLALSPAEREQYEKETRDAAIKEATQQRQLWKEREFGLNYGMRIGMGTNHPSMRHVLPPHALKSATGIRIPAHVVQGGSADYAAMIEKARGEWPGIREYSQAEAELEAKMRAGMFPLDAVEQMRWLAHERQRNIDAMDAMQRAGVPVSLKEAAKRFLGLDTETTGLNPAKAVVNVAEVLEQQGKLEALVPLADRMLRFLAGLDTSRNTLADQKEKTEIVHLVMKALGLIDPKKGERGR